MVELREITEDRKREAEHQTLIDIVDSAIKDTRLVRRVVGPADIELYASQFQGFLGKRLPRFFGRKVLQAEYAYNAFHVSVYDRAHTPIANRIGEGIENNWAYLYLGDKPENRPPKPEVFIDLK